MFRPEPCLLVVTYHYIRDPHDVRFPGIHPVSKARFREDIGRLSEVCDFATPQEAEAFLRGEASLGGPKALITFDDGLLDHWRAARQVLDPMDIKAAFFVASRPLSDQRALLVNKLQYLRSITEPKRFRTRFLALAPPEAELLAARPDFIEKAAGVYVHDDRQTAAIKYLANFSLGTDVTERIVDEMLAHAGVYERALCDGLYMNPDHLRHLDRHGHMVACHGHSHRPLGTMLPGELDQDVGNNIETLTAILGERPRWISYPYGRGDAIPRDTRRLCARHDLSVGFTLRPDWNLEEGEAHRAARVTENQYQALLDEVPCTSPQRQWSAA